MMKIKRRITKAYFDRARSQYAPLIYKLSFMIGIDKIQAEELRVCADIELLKCMICYNRSGSFITFLYSRLIGVFRHLRDRERRFKRIRIMPIDCMSSIAGPDIDMDFNMMIQECLECLNEEEYDVITQLFFNNKTMKNISASRGVVASTIYRIKNKAIDKMRNKCGVGLE